VRRRRPIGVRRDGTRRRHRHGKVAHQSLSTIVAKRARFRRALIAAPSSLVVAVVAVTFVAMLRRRPAVVVVFDLVVGDHKVVVIDESMATRERTCEQIRSETIDSMEYSGCRFLLLFCLSCCQMKRLTNAKKTRHFFRETCRISVVIFCQIIINVIVTIDVVNVVVVVVDGFI
jgi:hypothetical protein